jgi:hypothetical protein
VIVFKSPERGTAEATLVCQCQLHAKCLIVVVPNPLIVPGDFLDTGTTINDLRREVLVANDPSDLASAENTFFFRTDSSLARARELAAVVFAGLVGDGEAAPVVRDTHVDLCRLEVSGRKKVQRGIDLGKVGMRLDLGTQASHKGIPGSMEIVCQDREPVHGVLHLRRSHVFEVLVLSREDDRDAKVFSEAFT